MSFLDKARYLAALLKAGIRGVQKLAVRNVQPKSEGAKDERKS